MLDSARQSICHPVEWDGRAPIAPHVRASARDLLGGDAEILVRFQSRGQKGWICLLRAAEPAGVFSGPLSLTDLEEAKDWPWQLKEEVALLYGAGTRYNLPLPRQQTVLAVYRDVMSAGMASLAQRRTRVRQAILDTDTRTPMRVKITLLALAAFLALLFDNWFTKPLPGISAPLYVAMLLGAAAWSAGSPEMRKRWQPWVLAGVTWLLSVSYALYMNPALRTLNIIAIPLMAALTCVTFLGDAGDDWLYRWWDRLVTKPLGTGYKAVPILRSLWKKDMNREERRTVNQVLMGGLIAVPVLVVVFVLLTSADLIFASYARDVVEWIERIEFWRFFWHAVLVAVMLYYLFGSFWSLRYPADRIDPDPIARHRIRSVQPMMVLTVIGLLCALYAVFILIQSSYLYTGVATWRLPEGYTYAEYARRGFFEMIAVTGINMLLILISLPQGEAAPEKKKTVRIFATVLWAFSLNMLFVSVYKMILYIDAYGFTRLRLFVLAIQLVLAVSLAVQLLRIWRPHIPFVRIAASAAVCVYLILTLINMDAVIVRGNLALYRRTGRIDTVYMSGELSADAVPALRFMEGQIGDGAIKGEIGEGVWGYICDAHTIDSGRESDPGRPYWHQWNLSRYRALHSGRR